jgi:hypothetical protein
MLAVGPSRIGLAAIVIATAEQLLRVILHLWNDEIDGSFRTQYASARAQRGATLFEREVFEEMPPVDRLHRAGGDVLVQFPCVAPRQACLLFILSRSSDVPEN